MASLRRQNWLSAAWSCRLLFWLRSLHVLSCNKQYHAVVIVFAAGAKGSQRGHIHRYEAFSCWQWIFEDPSRAPVWFWGHIVLCSFTGCRQANAPIEAHHFSRNRLPSRKSGWVGSSVVLVCLQKNRNHTMIRRRNQRVGNCIVCMQALTSCARTLWTQLEPNKPESSTGRLLHQPSWSLAS